MNLSSIKALEPIAFDADDRTVVGHADQDPRR